MRRYILHSRSGESNLLARAVSLEAKGIANLEDDKIMDSKKLEPIHIAVAPLN
jgi:hypothetical protein